MPAARTRRTVPSPDPSAPAAAGSSSATTAPAPPASDAAPALRRLDPTPSDPRPDPTPAQIGAVAGAVVALVSVQLAGSGPPPPGWGQHRRDIVQDRREHGRVGMLAAVTTAVSGSPLPSQARWILDPGLPRSTGFAPTWSPAFGAHTGRVHAGARPVQPARQTKPVQHLQMELLEHPGLGPLVQPAPCRRRRAIAKFLGWQEPPRGRGAGHVDDCGETAAIRNRSPSAAIPGARCGRQQGCDHPPQLVGNEVLSKGRHDQKP